MHELNWSKLNHNTQPKWSEGNENASIKWQITLCIWVPACRTKNLQFEHGSAFDWLTSRITRITDAVLMLVLLLLPLSMNAIFIDHEFLFLFQSLSISLSLSLSVPLSLFPIRFASVAGVFVVSAETGVKATVPFKISLYRTKNGVKVSICNANVRKEKLFISSYKRHSFFYLFYTRRTARCCPFFGRKLCALDDSSISCTLTLSNLGAT